MEPITSEHVVTVTRQNQHDVYSMALKRSRAVYAVGPCGVGKSTYALAHLLGVARVPITVILPSGVSVETYLREMRGVASKLSITYRLVAYSATDFVRIDASRRRRIMESGVVVVDDVHSQDPAIMACVQLVREHATAYVLLTASSRVAGSALSHVTLRHHKDSKVSYEYISRNGIAGTPYDPSTWPAVFDSAVVYPVTMSMRAVLMAAYRNVNVRVQHAPTHKKVKGRTVIIAMPGTDEGATFDVDHLFDSGYTVAKVFDERRGLVYSRPVRCTQVQLEQRWARVGRQACGGKVHYAYDKGVPGTQTYTRQAAAIIMRACELNVKKVLRDCGLDIKHYDVGAAKSAVLTDVDNVVAEYYAGSRITPVTLYVGRRYSVPARALVLCGDIRPTRYVVSGAARRLSLHDAKELYYGSRNVYRMALLSLVFAGQKRGGSLDNTIARYSSKAAKYGFDLDDDDMRFVANRSDYTCESGRKYIYSKSAWFGRKSYVTDDSDYDTGVPQSKFVGAISYLSSLPILTVKQYARYVSNRHVQHMDSPRLLSGGEYYSRAQRQFQRAMVWAARSGLMVCVQLQCQGSSPSQYTSLEEAMGGLAVRRSINVVEIRAKAVVIRMQMCPGSGLRVKRGDKIWRDVTITGFDLMSCANVEQVYCGETRVSGGGAVVVQLVEVDETVTLPPPTKVNVTRGYAQLVCGTTSQKLVDVCVYNGLTLLFVALYDGEVADGDHVTVEGLRHQISRLSRRGRSRTGEYCVTAYIQESGGGDIVLDGLSFKFLSVSLNVLGNLIAETATFDVYMTDGTVRHHECLFYTSDMGEGAQISSYATYVKGIDLTKPVVADGNLGQGSADSSLTGGEDPTPPLPVAGGRPIVLPPVVVPAGALSGGNDNGLDDDIEINLTKEQLAQVPMVQAGAFLSKSEKQKVHKAFVEKCTLAGYIALLKYLITTDASERVARTDKIQVGDNEYIMQEVFNAMSRELDEGRFTVRRFARSFATQWLDLWGKAAAFEEMRLDKNSVLYRRGILPNAADMIYMCSFMDAVIPDNLRSKIATINKTRAILGSDTHTGQVNVAESVNVAENIGGPNVSFAARGSSSGASRQ